MLELGIEPRPDDYRSSALPDELLQHELRDGNLRKEEHIYRLLQEALPSSYLCSLEKLQTSFLLDFYDETQELLYAGNIRTVRRLRLLRLPARPAFSCESAEPFLQCLLAYRLPYVVSSAGLEPAPPRSKRGTLTLTPARDLFQISIAALLLPEIILVPCEGLEPPPLSRLRSKRSAAAVTPAGQIRATVLLNVGRGEEPTARIWCSLVVTIHALRDFNPPLIRLS